MKVATVEGSSIIGSLYVSVLAASLITGFLGLINSPTTRGLLGYPRIDVLPSIQLTIVACYSLLLFLSYAVNRRIHRTWILGLLGLLIFIWGNLVLSGLDLIGLIITMAAVVAEGSLTQPRLRHLLCDSRHGLLRAIGLCILSFLIPIELWALAHWLTIPFNQFFATEGGLTEFYLSMLAYPSLQLLLLVFLFSWVSHAVPKFKRFTILRKPWTSRLSSREPEQSCRSTRRWLDIRVVTGLAIAMFLGGVVGYFPYLGGSMGVVGQDLNEPIIGYLNVLREIRDRGFWGEVFNNTQVSSRPLFFLLLSATQNFVRSDVDTLRFTPVAIIALLVLGAYRLLRVGDHNRRTAVLSGFFVVFTFSTIIGMYTGILANWAALALMVATLGMYLKAIQKPSALRYAATVLFSMTVSLTHDWTFGFLIMILLVDAVISLLLEPRRAKFEIYLTSLIVAANTLLFYAASYFVAQKAPGLLLGSLEVAILRSLRIETVAEFWKALDYLVKVGLFTSPLMLILAALGTLTIGVRTKFDRLMTSWLITSSLGAIVIAPTGLMGPYGLIESYLWRVLFVAPFSIFAALGLGAILEFLGRESVPQTIASAHISLRKLAAVALLVANYLAIGTLLAVGFPTVLLLVWSVSIMVTLLTLSTPWKLNTYFDMSLAMYTILVAFNYTMRSMVVFGLVRPI